jgi:hypothetical protein
MSFFTVNFDLKTKIPSTILNKKKLKKINILKKKKKLKGWHANHPQRWPEPPLGVARGPPVASEVDTRPP